MISVCSSLQRFGRFLLCGVVLFAVFASVSSSAVAVMPVETEGAHADGGHDGDGHGGGHDTGVPMDFKSDLALWSFLVFVLFIGVLGKFAWKPLIDGLDQRESGILAAIAQAEENRRQSEQRLAEYQQKLKEAEHRVSEIIAEAKRDAERTAADIVASAEAQVTSMKTRAEEEIRLATNAALAEVFKQANSRIVLATEKVLGRAVAEADQERLVSEALSQLSS